MLLNTLFKHWSYRLFAPGVMLRQTYDAFKELLKEDGRSHDLMAELEVLCHDGKRIDFTGINELYFEFSDAVAAMVENLSQLHPTEAATLIQYFKKIDFYTRFLLAPPEELPVEPYVLALSQISDPNLSGNKAYNLARLVNELQAPVPDGFVISTNAFNRLLYHNNLRGPLNELLASINIEDTQSLDKISKQLISLVTSATVPDAVYAAVHNAYQQMEQRQGSPVLTAVRSSAVSEDSDHSFAGQYHTELGVCRENVLDAYLQVVASKYSPEALLYRITLGLADEEASMGVLVLTMVNASTSGVVYTKSPEQMDRCEMAIHGIYGLGEVLVGGKAVGDIAYLDPEHGEILGKSRGAQQEKLVLTNEGLVERELDLVERERFCLSEDRLHTIGTWARKIEQLYGVPQDIEWAVNEKDSLFILQSRPLQQEKIADVTQKGEKPVEGKQILLEGGQKASGGVASGRVVHVAPDGRQQIAGGTILVVRSTPPSLVRVLHKIDAVIAEQGSTAGHFATVCREFGIPLLIGVPQAMHVLSPGHQITVDAHNRRIYAGILDELVAVGRGKQLDHTLPYFRKLRAVMDFISPLNLLDPDSSEFRSDACRTMHDIIRYTHELAIRTMFSLGEKGGGRSSKRLDTDLPLVVNLLDVGGGFCPGFKDADTVKQEDICCLPFLSLWQGLSHPGVDWTSHKHFDWKTFDEVTLAGGVVSRNSGEFASYAILGRDYLNLNMRFGYHFTLVDTLGGADPRTNYCQLRFAGGGGNYTGRSLRLEFLHNVLGRLGFDVSVKADLLDARITEITAAQLDTTLDMLGRLLGATKLMDMVLTRDEDVELFVNRFFEGQYTFTQPVSPTMNS